MNEGVPATVSSDWLMVFLSNRVARLFVFKPKIPLWVNFGEPYIGKCLHVYMIFIFIGYGMTICYVFPHFGIKHQEKSGNPAVEGAQMSGLSLEYD
jgi:hypothetical protein